MSKTIKVEALQDTLKKYFDEYKEDIFDDVVEVTDAVTKEAIEELRATSPRGKATRRTKYYKGWSSKIQKRNKLKYQKVIWNKTNYQLTHLLEFGHATRNGGMTKAIPHIRPVEEKYGVKFVDLVEKKIRRTSE